jgi:hypothetical protein
VEQQLLEATNPTGIGEGHKKFEIETKDFGVGEPSFAVAWAIGKMLEAELIEEL